MPWISWRIHRHKILDSTNTHAAALIRKLWDQNQSAHGHLIVAQQQTAGRGQYGRSWESPVGGLYLSAIIEEIHPAARDKLALIAGVAVVNALQGTYGHHLRLRWPNDLMLDKKKLGGILCESLAQANRWAGIIGIGLNVNVHLDRLPKELQQNATSMLEHGGRCHKLPEIERHVMVEIEIHLDRVAHEGLAPIIQRVRQLDSLLGQQIEITDGHRTATGIADGIGDSGQLLLQTPNGNAEFTTGSLTAIAGQRLRSEPVA